MPVIGTPRSFHKQFSFVVEIDSVASAAFQKASGLSVDVAEVAYSEGGSIIPDKSPGRLTFADLTLERGATTDKDLYNWFLQVADAAAGVGLTSPTFKRTLDVVQRDRDGSELRRWRVVNAWPKKFTPGTWDNETDANVIESVVLCYDYFELIQS